MNLTININTTDRTDYVLWNKFSKVDNLNSRIDTCTFSTSKYGTRTWKPEVGDEIEVLDGASAIFAGVIIRVNTDMKEGRIQTYEAKCKDWTHYLDEKLVVERYTGKTVAQIISDLISNYTSGFTDTNVVCDTDIDSIAFNYITVSQAIQMLAEQVNYCWYVDYDKDIHFFIKNTNSASFDLTDDNGKYIFDSLQIKDDISQLRNRVMVRGGEKIGSSRVETFKGDGIKKTFALGHKFSEVPVVKVNTVAQTVGTEFLDDDSSFDCMWNFNEKYLRFTATAPPDTEDIEATGTPLIPILVQVQDDISIATYGEYEFRKVDKSIRTSDEAKQFALSQIESYGATIKEGSFDTYESGLRSGQIINVKSTFRGIDEDFLIQSATLKMRSPVDGIWHIELATLRTMGIITFLQELLLSGTKEITIGEDEVLEKYYIDEKDINVTEDISLHTEVTNHESIEITELLRKDPWTPIWVLSPYFPTSDSDVKREGRLDISMYLY